MRVSEKERKPRCCLCFLNIIVNILAPSLGAGADCLRSSPPGEGWMEGLDGFANLRTASGYGSAAIGRAVEFRFPSS